MSPSFAEIAPHYDALRPLSAGDRARLETMLREAALQPGDLVVEVGCGTGRLTLPLSAMTPALVTGVDAEVRMLDVARGKDAAGRVDWVRGSAYRLPLAEGTAALVMMVMVVHLLRQRVRAFREARRILRPGGQLSLWTFTPRHVEEFYLNPYFPSIAVIDRPRFPSTAMLSAELRRAETTRDRRCRRPRARPLYLNAGYAGAARVPARSAAARGDAGARSLDPADAALRVGDHHRPEMRRGARGLLCS